MSIGALEIVLCALVTVGALAAYIALLMFAYPSHPKAVRAVGLAVFGPPVLCAAAAILTPPDLITMLLLAIPLCALYGAAVVIWLLIRNRRHLRSEEIRHLNRGRQV